MHIRFIEAPGERAKAGTPIRGTNFETEKLQLPFSCEYFLVPVKFTT